MLPVRLELPESSIYRMPIGRILLFGKHSLRNYTIKHYNLFTASPTRNFVNGAGQLAEYVSMDNHAVNVFNSTCANTSLRIEVRAAVGPDEDADTMASPSSDASLDGAQSRSDGPSMTEQDGRTGGLVVPDAMSDAGPE